ncbi:hypothetical protein EON80_15665 [bacterium]|nr:MAG: hypothetical protein EON80_15665 [bacterium]
MDDLQIIRRDKDGNEIRVAAPAEVQQQLAAQEASQVADTARANEILSLIVAGNDSTVVKKEIVIGGVSKTFNVKRINHADWSKVEAKRYRRSSEGEIDYSTQEVQLNRIAWQLHYFLLQNLGSKKKPDWQPLFTLEQIQGESGLLNLPGVEARDLVHDLLDAINEVNFDSANYVFGMDEDEDWIAIKAAINNKLDKDSSIELRYWVAMKLRHNSGFEDYFFALDPAFVERVDAKWKELFHTFNRPFMKYNPVWMMNL